MRKSLILLLLALSFGFAQNIVVFPLGSQDISLGMAISQKLTERLSSSLEAYGPEIASNLLPPIVVEEGFFSISRRAPDFGTSASATMLREIIGSDYVLAGNLDIKGDEIDAHLHLSQLDSVYSFDITSDIDNPGAIVDSTLAILTQKLGLSLEATKTKIDLSTEYGDYIDALSMVTYGEIEGALERLDSLNNKSTQASALQASLEAVRVGLENENAALMATMSLALEPVDEQISLKYFKQFAESTSLPVAKVWLATLYTSVDDTDSATKLFDEVSDYPFGKAAKIAFARVNGADYADDLTEILVFNDTAALLAVASMANFSEDIATEKEALNRLTRLVPDYVYPFERLSFIAFDEDDAISAAQALAVAVRLEPDSDLYWTNLGWSYYLLGILDKSEEATLRAIHLDSGAYIALFNLGLTRTVTGRLEDALRAYDKAIVLDPEVDDEAVHDLENALDLYPNQAGVHYSLAYLYEHELRREEAAAQYQAYVNSADENSPLIKDAKQRVEKLLAPPPEFFISPEASVGLGLAVIDAAPYELGDLIYPSIEVYTDGDELPSKLSYELKMLDGDKVLAESTVELSVPSNAVGYVIEENSLMIPKDLLSKSYELELTLSSADGRKATANIELDVVAKESLLRQLISRDISLLDINEKEFYGAGDLNRDDEYLLELLVQELHGNAEVAEGAIPQVETGRFAGMSGGKLFTEATKDDVKDALGFLLSSDAKQSEFLFVEAFAQWALDGAPLVETK